LLSRRACRPGPGSTVGPSPCSPIPRRQHHRNRSKCILGAPVFSLNQPLSSKPKKVPVEYTHEGLLPSHQARNHRRSLEASSPLKGTIPSTPFTTHHPKEAHQARSKTKAMPIRSRPEPRSSLWPSTRARAYTSTPHHQPMPQYKTCSSARRRS